MRDRHWNARMQKTNANHREFDNSCLFGPKDSSTATNAMHKCRAASLKLFGNVNAHAHAHANATAK